MKNTEDANYKISIIMPVYNAGEYLKQSVDSILAQTYQNFELLLIDDESTDGSGEVCDRYTDKDSRIRVIHQKNSGCTAASLTGLRVALGNYIMFIDSDDYVDKDMLEKMAKQLVGKRGEIVCCNHILEKSRQSVPVFCVATPGVYEDVRLQSEIKEQLLGNEERTIPISRCMKLYEKSVFWGNEKYCDTSIHMGEDFNLVYPALLDCSRLVIMEKALFYHYRFVESSMVHRYDSNILDSIERVNRLLHRVVEGKGIKTDLAALDREYCYMLLLVMKNELRNPKKNYMQKIRKIFARQEMHRKIMDTPISVKDKANALLYFGMRHPNKAVLRVLRMIIRQYDKRNQRHGN